jgi:hypothetical protein
MRSIYDNVATKGFAIAWNTLDGVIVTGAAVDTLGYNTAALKVYVSAVGAGIGVGAGSSLAAVLEESADNVTFAAALDNGGTQIGTSPEATTTAVISGARIEGLGLSNRKRYIRVKTTAHLVGTASKYAFSSCAVLILGRAYQNPVVTTASNT